MSQDEKEKKIKEVIFCVKGGSAECGPIHRREYCANGRTATTIQRQIYSFVFVWPAPWRLHVAAVGYSFFSRDLPSPAKVGKETQETGRKQCSPQGGGRDPTLGRKFRALGTDRRLTVRLRLQERTAAREEKACTKGQMVKRSDSFVVSDERREEKKKPRLFCCCDYCFRW